jgi:hypothetical protein
LYQLFSFPGPPDSSLHIVGPTKPPPLTPRCRAPLPRRPPGRRRQRRDALELLLYLRSTTAAAHAPLTCNCVQPLPPLEAQRHHSWAERTPVARCLGAAPSVNRCILHHLSCVKFSSLNYSWLIIIQIFRCMWWLNVHDLDPIYGALVLWFISVVLQLPAVVRSINYTFPFSYLSLSQLGVLTKVVQLAAYVLCKS